MLIIHGTKYKVGKKYRRSTFTTRPTTRRATVVERATYEYVSVLLRGGESEIGRPWVRSSTLEKELAGYECVYVIWERRPAPSFKVIRSSARCFLLAFLWRTDSLSFGRLWEEASEVSEGHWLWIRLTIMFFLVRFSTLNLDLPVLLANWLLATLSLSNGYMYSRWPGKRAKVG